MKIASKLLWTAVLPALLLVSGASASAASAAKHAPTHEDIWLMKRVGAPQVSPNGRWVVVLVTEPSYDENSQLADLWLIDTTAKNSTRRLTSTRRPESGVVWSPDSKRIVFSAQRDNDDAPQLYVLNLADGGEAQRLTNLSGGARAPVMSHDGKSVAFVAVMFRNATDDKSNRDELEAHRNRKSLVRAFDGFPVRNWDHWLDDRQVRIFVQALDADGLASGSPRDLLGGTRLAASAGFAGRQTDTGEEMDMEFAPDDASVVFAATTNRNAAAYSFTDSQLFSVDVAGGEPRALTSGTAQWSNPRFTPDGRTLLALHEAQDGKNVYNSTRLAALPWPVKGEPRIISEPLDRSVGTFAATPDSRTVYFTAEDSGHERIYSVRVGGGAVTPVPGTDRGTYTGLAIPERGNGTPLFATWESASDPGEVVVVTPEGRTLMLTKFTGARVAQLDLPKIESYWYTSSRGKRIHSFIVRPPGFDASKKYPLFVLIHGGPHGMWRDQFFIRWNYHLLAAPGYVLVLTNYSGSTGFGEQFARSIQGDPFRGPGDEINEAADAAIRQFPFIDGSRQCAGGASYGGHLANWLQASTTRYKCLVSHAGLVNLEAQWGTSDTIYGREVNLGGPPWEKAEVWADQNPIRFAAKFRTPVLVSVGENDFRVPLNNTLEYWSALQRMKVPSRLLVFPEENHWILKGEDSKVFYSEIAAWLDRWLKQP